jgi:phosphoribosylaminoimidazole carboxylase (NCAIR synthetase)
LTASPDARLRVYGTAKPTAGCKMGHVLVLDDTLEQAFATAREIDLRLDLSRRGHAYDRLDTIDSDEAPLV